LSALVFAAQSPYSGRQTVVKTAGTLCDIKIEIYGMRRVHAAQKTLEKKYRSCFNINSWMVK
jgi:hypothetical protein